MLPVELIRQKRQGKPLTPTEIQAFVTGITDHRFDDAQLGAMAMAIFLNGLSIEETVALTQAMQHSGTSLHWKNIVDGPVVDKHSTGGVGDKVSLMLAPLVACCGVYVPMITGQGLGHTGGTVDKMQSIPGYNMYPDTKQFQQLVKQYGSAIIGQTSELAPADKRLYSIRDITGTVESIPLITASILSKKLAEGLDALVMDVKVGNGAMMQELTDAKALANSIVTVAQGAGVKASALITDMNQILGTTAGNALEIKETIDYLSGKERDPRLHHIVLSLGSKMLQLAGVVDNDDAGFDLLNKQLHEGYAVERFAQMVSSLGGPTDFIDQYEQYLPQAKHTVQIKAPHSGYINTVDTYKVGMLIVALGGGRRHPQDRIQPGVGLSNILPLGSWVNAGDPIVSLHTDQLDQQDLAEKELYQAITISDNDLSNDILIHDGIN